MIGRLCSLFLSKKYKVSCSVEMAQHQVAPGLGYTSNKQLNRGDENKNRIHLLSMSGLTLVNAKHAGGIQAMLPLNSEIRCLKEFYHHCNGIS